MLNKVEATKLFEKKACLVCDRDVIPEREARKIVGDKAITFANRIKFGSKNGYGIGDYTMDYLPKEGFFLAVTYMNVDEERKKRTCKVSRELVRS